MIRYSLKCHNDHSFDSWFKSAGAFDTLTAADLVACSLCGSTRVQKSLMAPSVKIDSDRPLSQSQNPTEEAFAALRREIEDNSEYVGLSFATEARAIHEGSVPERAIYGEVKPDEARALIQDGIPVAPLPFAPRRRTN